jgi:hypothetical protein
MWIEDRHGWAQLWPPDLADDLAAHPKWQAAIAVTCASQRF